jgi:hypothetical protein
MDLIFSKVMEKKNIKIISDDNYFKPLEEKKSTDDSEFTVDGLPTLEKQLRDIENADKSIKESNYNKDMIMRVKCISLYKMGKPIMLNTYNMNKRDKDKLQLIMHTYNDVPHEDIINEFNEIVNIDIFEKPDLDYSNLPIYNA